MNKTEDNLYLLELIHKLEDRLSRLEDQLNNIDNRTIDMIRVRPSSQLGDDLGFLLKREL